MTLIITLKGGPNSGWYAPPRGTHSGDKHRAVGSGKSVKREPDADKWKSNDALVAMFDKGLSNGWMNATPEERAAVKEEIMANVWLHSGGVTFDDAGEVMHQWSFSSSDHDVRSLEIQKDAAAEFGIPVGDFIEGRSALMAKRLQEQFALDKSMFGYTRQESLDRMQIHQSPLMESSKQRSILRGMYNHTQKELAAAGYAPDDEITVYRGIRYESFPHSEGDVVQASGNPLESWSIDLAEAQEFAGSPSPGEAAVILRMDVPIKNIASTARTGNGCLIEGEVVTMGSIPTPATVIMAQFSDEDIERMMQ